MLQAAAIPDMLQGGDILLASHTGSGKTLAYLLPLVWNQRNHPFWAGSRTNLHYALLLRHCMFSQLPSSALSVAAVRCSLLRALQVHKLRQQEQDGQQTKPRRPRALVLGPTRELTDQILQVAKSLSHHARFRSACVNGGNVLSFQHTMHLLAASNGMGLLHNGAAIIDV